VWLKATLIVAFSHSSLITSQPPQSDGECHGWFYLDWESP